MIQIYITIDTNKTYRWSGSIYAIISDTLALGETSSTAYRGDRGKAAYDGRIDSFSTTGTGAASFTANALNIPTYAHPSKVWVDKTTLANAYVISNLSIDSFGHLTDWTTR